MITLHHLEYSQSFRILWLLEELGVEYKLELYERDPKTFLAPAQYKALSPIGTAPVISDGDLVLSESNAIVDYILDKYPDNKLRPAAGSTHRARYLFWLHAGQGSVTPLLLMNMIFGVISKRAPFFVKPIIRPILSLALDSFATPRMKKILQKAEADLEQAPWFGGDTLSAADIVLSYTLLATNERGYITQDHPHCKEWLKRIETLPSFQSARKKDGKPSVIFSVPN